MIWLLKTWVEFGKGIKLTHMITRWKNLKVMESNCKRFTISNLTTSAQQLTTLKFSLTSLSKLSALNLNTVLLWLTMTTTAKSSEKFATGQLLETRQNNFTQMRKIKTNMSGGSKTQQGLCVKVFYQLSRLAITSLHDLQVRTSINL